MAGILSLEALATASQGFNDALQGKDDLSVVLISVAYIEQCLGSLLRRFFIAKSSTADKMFDYNTNGMLTDLVKRAKLAYCLGLISTEFLENVELIAQIRNRFAHSHFKTDFTDNDISKWVASLNQTSSMTILLQGAGIDGSRTDIWFTFCVTSMVVNLLNNGKDVIRCGPQYIDPAFTPES